MATPPPGPGDDAGGSRVISDLIDIPQAVHEGDLVVKLTESTSSRQAQALSEYVVTSQLAESFDQALETIRSSVVDGKSQASYLHGSFGAGKSHFLAVLSAILDHHPDARGKAGLADTVAKHDAWLQGKKFIEVKSHLIGEESIESHILGGYVRQVRAEYPDASVPAVYRADGLLADARELRAREGDAAFIAQLPPRETKGESTGTAQDAGAWGDFGGPATWTTETLDQAFAVVPETASRADRALRDDLVSALIAGPFKRFTEAVGDSSSAYVGIDEGLAVISRHASEQLGCDAVILLLDELILRFTAFIGDEGRINSEIQKIAKLVESSQSHRPAPIISFVPRQRDLRDLVGLGGGTEGVSQTINYWDGRFGHIKLADANLTEVVRHRLIKPRDDRAAAEIDTAFERMSRTRPEVRDALLDSEGGETSTWEDFRKLYPFSPALLHVMVDLSAALQRQRSALKLLLQLLVKHRDTLPVGQMVPLGAVFDVLFEGEDRPFTDQFSAEYTKIRTFYRNKVRPWLLNRNGTSEAEAAGLDVRAPFRREDLLVKTLLLSALTPYVPALKDLTAGRAIALNQGIVKARRTGQDVAAVTQFFKDMAAQFGEVRVGAQATDPTVSLNLLRVDTESLMRTAYSAANDHALRHLFKRLLWKEMGLDEGAARTNVVWRGTQRLVEVAFGNVRSEDMGREEFQPEHAHAVRVVLDYPFDEDGKTPAEDRHRVQSLREEFPTPPATLVWLPTFLSPRRLEDARRVLMMEYLLQPDVIEEKAPDWSSDDRREARAQLDNQRNQLTAQISGLMRGAYGLVEADPDSTDYDAHAERHIEPLPPSLTVPLEAGSQFPAAMERITRKLLDHLYPEHPDFSIGGGKTPVRRADLSTVLGAVEAAKAEKLHNHTPAKTDLPALRRIADPLEIAKVTEVFVLRDEWVRRLDHYARINQAETTDIRVRDLKRWIRDREDGRGLPEDVVDLLVQVYAIQSDRAWIRAGKRYTGIGFGQLSDDIVLRRQELPTQEDFDRANERAEKVFGLSRQPVLNARAVQRMAEQLKEQATRWQASTEHLVRELAAHADILGLDEDAPRLRTARATDDLLGRMRGLSDDTALVTVLGQADLPEEAAVYKASMAGAGNLADALAATQWDMLRALERLAGEGGDDHQRAADTLADLREAARHNAHSKNLATVLSSANSTVVTLLVNKTRTDERTVITDRRQPVARDKTTDRTPQDTGTGDDRTRADNDTWVRVEAGEDVAAAVERLREKRGIDPDAKIEISIRVAE
ncbi:MULTISPECIES: phage resistance protein [Nocardiopsis]|uniref:Phage resistance protein n=1 Tax=Nocardiopsis sinuspersici TaxID=501010 RepID=A0A1V3C0R1_9ACTN|nr:MULTISPECIES: phage resistance protein [Nocardiopsis]OOC54278.1 phage resistance protein [Nocardiopsis sinuspersici]